MHIHNIRMGFATNSSSLHSPIMGWNHGLRDHDLDGHSFGWQEFCCASPEVKTSYLAQTLFENLRQDLGEDIAAAIVREWCETSYDERVLHEGYVDHQSLQTFPCDVKTGHVSRKFFRDFLARYRRSDIVIVGGNDNDTPSVYTHGRQRHLLPTEEGYGNILCRKSGDWWTLFNKRNGAKFKLSLEENPGSPLSPATPELVDLKITDKCSKGCPFCAVEGTKILTPLGEVPIEDISVGDMVYGNDTSSGAVSEVEVTETFVRDYDGEIIVIETESGRKIELTPDHLVMTNNRGWVPACEIEVDDDIVEIS